MSCEPSLSVRGSDAGEWFLDAADGVRIGGRHGKNGPGGAGLGMGVEYFLSKTLSLAAHTRLAQYSFRQEKSESGSGDTAYTHTKNTHTLSLGIAAALFMRIYF